MKYQLGRSYFRTLKEGMEKEWLMTNGIGGVSNKTIVGASNRNHSGYLSISLNPPADRWTVLSNVHESIIMNEQEIDLASQEYLVFHREGYRYLNRFELDVVPTYTYQVEDFYMKKTISLEYGKNTVVVCYQIENGGQDTKLQITPLFNCKPYGEAIEKSELLFDTNIDDNILTLIPSQKEAILEKGIGVVEGTTVTKDIKISFLASEGDYFNRSLKPTSMATPNYVIEENQVYGIDSRNGFTGVDNHATPYDVIVKLKPFEKKKLYLKCTVEQLDSKDGFTIVEEYKKRVYQLVENAGYHDLLANRLVWAADNFIVDRKSTGLKTILAGYPWFLDWGRDTMIALQGLTLSTKRFEECRQILESFSKYVKNGLLPNVFPGSSKEEPMYNTIDASMWYFYSVYKYLEYTGDENDYNFIQTKIYPVLKEIIMAYKNGTDFNIHMDQDGLIIGGSNLDQLTWMDVRVGDWVVTPRHGKAVEINGLWYNALRIMETLSERFGDDKQPYSEIAEKVKKNFVNKFWNEDTRCLYDCIEVTESGVEIPDAQIRPNQIWVVSLPFSVLEPEKEKQIVQTVYRHLFTPYGMRSLSFNDAKYKGSYTGKMIDRDGAYHMGTAWGFISGGFISAYCKVNQHSKEAVQKANEMCQYFADHMQDGCLNGIAEVFDGDYACTSRGCYTQAWSVGEVLRAYTEDVLPYL